MRHRRVQPHGDIAQVGVAAVGAAELEARQHQGRVRGLCAGQADVELAAAIGGDEEQATELDALLWSFRADSFLPHGLHGDHPDEAVVCGSGEDPSPHHDLLINLSNATPQFFSRFSRLAEIIIEDDSVRVPARDRFRFYRERGYPLKSHQIRVAQ